MNRQLSIPESPYHPLSSLAIILLDGIWGVGELEATLSAIGLPAVPFMMAAAALTCTISVTLTQHFIAREAWGPSLAKAVLAGIIAGVPYPVAGTAAGAILLGWSGLHRFLPPGDPNP